MNREVVSIAPPQRYGKAIPSSCGNARRNWASSRLERGFPPVELRSDPAAAMVDRVVPAPQDPVVGREPEVVELVVRVGQSLPPLPPDRRALSRRQRLGHERVVVDGHERRPEPAQPARVGGRGDDDVRGADLRAGRGRRDDAPGPSREAADRRALVDPDTTLVRDACDAPAELGGVDEDVAPGWSVQPGMPERRVDLGAHGSRDRGTRGAPRTRRPRRPTP